MFFLIQIKKTMDGIVSKGTSDYTTEKDALIQFHVALSSAMNKADTQLITCAIMDEYATIIKRESWSAPVVQAEETAETAEA